ncbi:MAG: ATP-binding protein [Chloroflexota bacterium]
MTQDQPTKILYIEDNNASRLLVQRVLGSKGYEVHVANDGLEGIVIARKQKPKLILIDINLPNMDGREITTRLRSLPHFTSIPIVALTANNSPGSRELALAAGCTGFLTKPIDVSRFPGQVEDFLQGRVEPLSDNERAENLQIHAQKLVERLETKVRELESVNHRLRELDQMKSDFIVLVSHELRTPLTLISGYSYLLEEHLKRANDIITVDSLGNISNGLNLGVTRMQEVIDEIINFSRVAAGMLDLSFGPVSLQALFNEVKEEFAAICEKRQLNLHIGDFRHVPLIEGDGGQLLLAFSNILSNAIKFTPDGGNIFVIGRIRDNLVEILVRDTGIGIPAEEQQRIFEQFYVLGSIEHHSTSKYAFQGGGLGLGLAVAKGIVEAHNGRISVESERRDPDNLPGSTFHVFLPTKRIN